MSSDGRQSPWMNDDLRAYRTAVRQFLAREFTPVQARWREQQHPDAEAWRAAGRAGLLIPDAPQKYGGGGGAVFARHAVVQEELVTADVHFGCHIQSIVAQYILAFGTESQKQRWLPRMASGEEVGAIGMSEPTAGSDLQSIKTEARREGDHYVVNGTKAFVTNGFHASLVCLAVKTDPKAAGPNGISLIVVETKNLLGYRVGRILEKVGRHAQDVCEIVFENARVPAANLLGPAEGKGFAQMMRQLPYERLSVAVTAVAAMERAVEVTTKYAKERTAFGKSLLDFQNTRFKLAECKTNASIGRVFLDDCIQRFIAGDLDAVTAAMAKYWLTERQGQVVDECLQIHGGYGYLADRTISRLWADSRVERIYAGTNEIMKEVIGWSL
jgi:acyl-CoA dehydrogenase